MVILQRGETQPPSIPSLQGQGTALQVDGVDVDGVDVSPSLPRAMQVHYLSDHFYDSLTSVVSGH